MKNDEKGMTLVELLAALVIASFIAGIIYSVIFLAMDYFTLEAAKARLQQEANYIITELQRVHRQCDYYELSILEGKIMTGGCIDETGNPAPNNNKTISSGYVYSPAGIYVNYEVNSKIQNIVFDEFNPDMGGLKIQDTEHAELNVEISTVITRYQK